MTSPNAGPNRSRTSTVGYPTEPPPLSATDVAHLPGQGANQETLDRFACIAAEGARLATSISGLEAAGMKVFQALADPGLDADVRQAGLTASFDVIGSLVSRNYGLAASGREDWNLRPALSRSSGTLQSVWRVADARCRQAVATVAAVLEHRRIALSPRARGSWLALSRLWTWIGMALTGVLCLLVLGNHYPLALGVLVVRLVGSIVAGTPFISDNSIESLGRLKTVRSRNMWGELYACLGAHLCDVAVLSTCAYELGRAGQVGWARFGYIAGSWTLFGALTRVGAERMGALVTRSILERVFRTGSTVAALVFASLSVAVPVPALALPVLVFAVYATIEVARVAVVVSNAEAPMTAVTLATKQDGHTSIDGCRAEVFEPRQLAAI